MDRVFEVHVHLHVSDEAEACRDLFHYNLVAEDDLDARQKSIVLTRENWKNLYGKRIMPPVVYCETELIVVLSEDVYGEESIDGG